ncbi:hypothetical protein PDESU_00707 [Pontiella desulfatans]|uniref:Uncharacterized protein n=1 Tax=Pontiella desulfatans TaxID=2750659 RepID=A0A6C2TY71_PONDE|nr:glycosyltransferase [Pontiella desulfatans]VGO12156.1 hypothetical protein PDESU_00707 [Pontiella desulfatans]
MNLLFVCHQRRFKADLRPGRLARFLAERGHHVTLLCIADHAKFRMKKYMQDGVCFIETPDLLFGSLRSGWDPASVLRRRTMLGKLGVFDLVHVFETRPATIYPVLRFLKKHPAPLVIDWIDWWGRGGIITTNRPKWYQVLFGPFETFYEEHYRTLANATTVICTALGHRAEGLGVHPDSIFKVPIGADTEAIPFVDPATHRSAFDFLETDRIALFSAMDAVMDVELVFSAAKRVHAVCPEFKLVMTGNGAERLTQQAKAFGIGDFFVHLGRLPQEQFVEALTCADVFLLPFADEIYNRGRWPCKIGDYLAAGRPIVSNPVGEVRELMQKHQVGILTDFDSDKFAEGIKNVLEDLDQSRSMGQNARHVAENELAWDGILDELEHAYGYAMKKHQKVVGLGSGH